jgi:hypothetical protein
MLTDAERSAVLAELIGSEPALAAAADEVALRLLASTTIEQVATEVSETLRSTDFDQLGARTGRIWGGGYVHETDAGWEQVEEVSEPFLRDMWRRATLGLLDAASVVALGTVTGLYQVRDPDDASVLDYAGADGFEELATQYSTRPTTSVWTCPRERRSVIGPNRSDPT